ncbi:hypothetical protein FA09DRAFT_332189 [Tilletiopsis washingtonensis]|uniref:Uncharacterized protein n=1 Tax=Tilletiopsis washingtonensis TaxID=58919 RepID=A0A316Z2X9_9BASI|nr:hypothetical protein FA09DRAFT_332189 [Tilletiopsis washingtonensis]PWN95262.1 hypothetical protein FA09DRAFT_332189 [Tilletiopsis washingtonensis]
MSVLGSAVAPPPSQQHDASMTGLSASREMKGAAGPHVGPRLCPRVPCGCRPRLALAPAWRRIGRGRKTCRAHQPRATVKGSDRGSARPRASAAATAAAACCRSHAVRAG